MACQFDARVPEMTRNLSSLYTLSSSSDRALGLSWYPSARKIVGEWASHYRYHETTVACVIAALSPQIDWERNLVIAEDILACRPISLGGALHTNIAKAIQLREQVGDTLLQSAEERMAAIYKSGPKVCSFAANLSGITDYVTIDGHAMQAALNDCTARYTLKWGPYTVFASVYAAVAESLSIAPCDFQALIWTQWKRLYPRETKKQIMRGR